MQHLNMIMDNKHWNYEKLLKSVRENEMEYFEAINGEKAAENAFLEASA